MRNLPGQRQRRLADALARPLRDDLAGAAVERQNARPQRSVFAIDEIEPVAVRRRRHRLDIGSRAAAGGDGGADRFRRRPPKPVHVALDPTGMWHRLRHAPSLDREGRAVDIEDNGFADRKSAIDSEQTGHRALPSAKRNGVSAARAGFMDQGLGFVDGAPKPSQSATACSTPAGRSPGACKVCRRRSRCRACRPSPSSPKAPRPRC